MAFPGLSPLARGNLGVSVARRESGGPIPARAGQPTPSFRGPGSAWAYPRSRGATGGAGVIGRDKMGLSPLARGNRTVGVLMRWPAGPIPARAGQPSASGAWRPSAWAYPRSRGATASAVFRAALFTGLSPLARGNLDVPGEVHAAQGPIPARAGQPARRADVFLQRRAYPRSRGATAGDREAVPVKRGLSPLARGNLPGLEQAGQDVRPIPARAGQPRARSRTSRPSRAYPRSRGATTYSPPPNSPAPGLSPLARGNRIPPPRPISTRGPIPARAGQPRALLER